MEILLLICFMALPIPEQLPLDEIYIQNIWRALANDYRVIMSYAGNTAMENKLGIFSRKTARVTIVDDPRIKAFIPNTFRSGKGFGLFSPVTNWVTYLSKDGEVIKGEPVDTYEGWNNSLSMKSGIGVGDMKVMCTFLDRESDALLLGVIDFDLKSLEILASTPSDDLNHYWLLAGDSYYWLTRETGSTANKTPGSCQPHVLPGRESLYFVAPFPR